MKEGAEEIAAIPTPYLPSQVPVINPKNMISGAAHGMTVTNRSITDCATPGIEANLSEDKGCGQGR